MTPNLTSAPMTDALSLLPPVGLAELDRQAALQTRVDRKYLLRPAQADLLLRRLDGARALEIDGTRRAAYASTYLDTAELRSYLDAAHARRRRFKVRCRRYLDTGTAYWEVKTRGGRGTTVKERVPATGLTAAERAGFVAAALGRAGIGGVDVSALQPVLETRYDRATVYLPRDGARVTLDTGLTWALPDGPASAPIDLVVVETKSGAAACTADRVLWRAGVRPVRLSKYGTGLAALRDDLPSNRWHAVLRRHALAPSSPLSADPSPSPERMSPR